MPYSCLALLIVIATSSVAPAAAWKPFLRYSKTTLSLAPARTSLDVAELEADANVVTLQPAAAPALGLAVTFDSFLTLAYSQTRKQWQKRSEQGKTEQTYYELHTTKHALQFDLHVSHVRGLFQDRHPRTDLRPFQDRLFRDASAAVAHENMRLSVIAMGVQWTLWPERFDAGAAFQQTNKILADGWSPVFGSFVHNVALANPEPFIPSDIAAYFASYGSTKNFFLKSFGLTAGVGGTLVHNDWFAAGQVLAGMGVASVATAPRAGKPTSRATSALDLRGSAGHVRGQTMVGITGYKMIVSGRLAAGGVSSSTSQLEIFWLEQL